MTQGHHSSAILSPEAASANKNDQQQCFPVDISHSQQATGDGTDASDLISGIGFQPVSQPVSLILGRLEAYPTFSNASVIQSTSHGTGIRQSEDRFMNRSQFIVAAHCTLLLFTHPSCGPVACAADPDTSRPFEWLIPGTVHDEHGAPVPGAIVESVGIQAEGTESAIADEQGKFVLQFQAASQYSRNLLIRSPDESLMSFVTDVENESRKLLRVILKPTRPVTVTVTVVDINGQPITEALVEVIASLQFIPLQKSIASRPTNNNGQATLQLPADARVDWITARHDDHGYDYYENYDSYPTPERLPVPRELTLTLNNGSQAEVKVVDSQDKPLAGAELIPWTIHKKGKLSDVNLSGMSSGVTSDANGIARFPWIPTDLVGRVTFLVNDRTLHCPQSAVFPSNGPSIAKIFRTAIVRGKITYADGSPAQGIHLQGEGRGHTNHYFHGHTMTVEDGTYEIRIYPDRSTILAVTENAWAAKSHTDIKLDEGQIKEHVDFIVGDGTLRHGKITIGPDAVPCVGETATLLQKFGDTKLVRGCKTDKNGTYRFRIGPGDYSLRLPNHPWENAIALVVEDRTEIIHDGYSARKERVTLNGSTVDADGKPISNSLVYGESIAAPGHAGFRSKVDLQGQFSTERWSDHMLLYGFNNERKLAGFIEIHEDDVEVQIPLAPAATVTGRVLDTTGQPRSNVRVVLSLGRPENRSLRLSTPTNELGKYVFPAVAPGSQFDIKVYTGNQSTAGEGFDVKNLTDITVQDITVQDIIVQKTEPK